MQGKFFLWIAVLSFMTLSAKGQDKEIVPQVPPSDSSRSFQKAGFLKIKFRSFSYNYYDRLGAACKMEYKLEKASGIPFRFRLGSIEETDYMEQKPNAIKPSLMGH